MVSWSHPRDYSWSKQWRVSQMHPHSNSDEFSHITPLLRMVCWKVGWSAGAIPEIVVGVNSGGAAKCIPIVILMNLVI